MRIRGRVAELVDALDSKSSSRKRVKVQVLSRPPNNSMKPIPVQQRIKTQPYVVGGCLIVKDDKFLLVQEAVAEAGTWNHPAGWLDLGEDIATGAKREAEEETGLQLKITGLLGVYPILKSKEGAPNHAVKFIYIAKPLTTNLVLDKNEIADARWFTLSEVETLEKEHVLRDIDIINQIKDYQGGRVYPIEAVKQITDQMGYTLNSNTTPSEKLG